MRSLRRRNQVSLEQLLQHNRRIRPQKVRKGAAKKCKFLPSIGSTFVIRIVDLRGKKPMARVTRTMDVDLRFGDPARDFSDLRIGVRAGDLACKRFDLCGHASNRQAQAMAKSVLRRSGAAICGLRAGAVLCVLAVSSNFGIADHAALRLRLVRPYELGIVYLLVVAAQWLGERFPTAIHFAQNGVAARF